LCSNEQADCRRSGTLEIIDSDRSRNTLSDGSNQERIRLRLAIIAATIFIVAGIALFYVPVAHDGLPIGWDTPHYIGGAIVLASEGPLALLSLQGPYNFIYQLLEGGLVWIGVPGTSLEVFLPVILAASIPYLLSRLVLEHLGTRTAILVTLATPGWYAVYRLQADLHANLLALTLFLSALILLSKARSVREPPCLYGLGLVALASITHIELPLWVGVGCSCINHSHRINYVSNVCNSSFKSDTPATIPIENSPCGGIHNRARCYFLYGPSCATSGL